MPVTLSAWTGEVMPDADESGLIQSVNAIDLIDAETVARVREAVAMHYDETPISISSMRPVLDQIENYMHFLIRQRSLWKGVQIDSFPELNRLYMDWDDDFRIFLHEIKPIENGQTGRPVLHYHQWQSIVRMHRGMYREIMAFGPIDDPHYPPVHSSAEVMPGSVREYLHPDLWHATEPMKQPTYSTMIVKKNSWRTPIKVTGHTTSLRYPQLNKGKRAEMFEVFEDVYPVDDPQAAW